MNLNRLLSFDQRNPASWLGWPLSSTFNGTEGPYDSPDPVECFTLYHLASECNGNAAEFGSWRGRSACFLASGLPTGRKLYAIDHFAGDDTGGDGACRNAMEISLINFGLSDKVEIIEESMLTFDVNRLKDVSLVFYDANHNAPPTIELLTRIHPVLNAGCLVVVHDANFPSTKEALAALCQDGEGLYYHLATINVWEGLAILRKT